jgi:hypothetical protein
MQRNLEIDWSDFKSFLTTNLVPHQHVELPSRYVVIASDGPVSCTCTVDKGTAEGDEFEADYKGASVKGSVDISGRQIFRQASAVSGWTYQAHYLDFTTCQITGLNNTKDGVDLGFTTIDVKNSSNTSLLTQPDCDASGVVTIVDWMPTHDYEIVGATLVQPSPPASDVRMEVIGVPDIPEAYGGSKRFSVGGINLKLVPTGAFFEVDGRASKLMTYSASLKTNKIRIRITHDAGFKHRIGFIFQIFKA